MSFLDGVKNMFRFQDDEDYEDEYDDEYEDGYDDEEDEEPVTRKKLFSGNRKPAKVNDEPETSEKTSYTFTDAKTNKASRNNKIVPIKTSNARGLEVVVIRPESMEDASEITDTLLSGKAVVLNLEGIHVEVAQRIIDYSAGSCYAMRGNLQKITNYIFLVTPPNVDISGDIPEVLAGGIDVSTFNKSMGIDM